jgi:L-glyceraldehyde 3-phosphate reductase
MGLEYFDIFYSHRPDPATPIEETLGALEQLVRQGKTLYVGLSNYPGEAFSAALAASAELGGPRILVHQPHYNLLARGIEGDLLPRTTAAGVGLIAYGPLASGMLTEKYLGGDIPADSRAARKWGSEWVTGSLTENRRRILLELDSMARARDQSLAQMALAWVIRQEAITTALVGASSLRQLQENVAALSNLAFGEDELRRIDALTA